MKMPSEYLQEIIRLLYEVHITTGSGRQLGYDEGIGHIVDLLWECRKRRRHVFFCGNGGSAGIAQHMTADYMKNGGIRTYSLYEQAALTCVSNDYTYEAVFSKQLEWLAEKGDVLVAISSSGESRNIVNAIRTMRAAGGAAVTLTGFREDNRIRGMGDVNLYVPAPHYGMVESVHNLLLQQIADILMDKNTEENADTKENVTENA